MSQEFAILYLLPVNSYAEEIALLRANSQRACMDSEYSEAAFIALMLDTPPKDDRSGFVFGADSSCDIAIPGRQVSGRHFAITLCPTSGIPVIVNNSSQGTKIDSMVLSKRGDSRVIQQNSRISFAGFKFMAVTPRRESGQRDYRENLSRYLQCLREPGDIISVYANPIQSPKQIASFLEIKRLGSGNFGDVFLFVDIKTGETSAAKIFQDHSSFSAVRKEIKTLQGLSHVS
jgi:hypothetical protein